MEKIIPVQPNAGQRQIDSDGASHWFICGSDAGFVCL